MYTSVEPHHTITARFNLFFRRNLSISRMTAWASAILFPAFLTFLPSSFRT